MLNRIILLLLIIPQLIFSQENPTNPNQKFTISGYVKDGKNGEALIGALVYKKDTQLGSSTNEYGFYSLTLPAGKHTLLISFVGYTSIMQEIDLTKNNTL
ncbi:MAG TPA: carboxypeptidase-like regulatory domain-containing protein, partial [Bacteroidia bacterium]|nr:carboxypeptidase-like regulatory domain-containing protein [Bacteroidia bacterium]